MKFPKGIAEGDFILAKYGRLRGRVVVFKTQKSMREQFREAFDVILPQDTAAAVVVLETGNYFCCMGFAKKTLTMEFICHEAVHAAHAYRARVKRDIYPGEEGDEEERIAYPAGKIASVINKWAKQEKLYVDGHL